MATGNDTLRNTIAVMDIKSAFLYADAERLVYVKLPESACRGDLVYGRLRKAMYGTRDAPQLWQVHLSRTLSAMGFVESVLQPGMYRHPKRGVEAAAHVDDIIASGEKADLDWFVASLRKSYELTNQFLGPGGVARQNISIEHWRWGFR